MFDKYREKERARRAAARADLARIREEWRDARADAKAENEAKLQANLAARAEMVAEHAGVCLVPDRIEFKGESHPLVGVRARVEEQRTGAEWGGIEQKRIWLTVTGPGFEWPVRAPEIVSSRKAREFAAKVTAAGSSAGEVVAPEADVAGQLRELAALHQAGALTDEEFAVGKARVLGLGS